MTDGRDLRGACNPDHATRSGKVQATISASRQRFPAIVEDTE